MPTLLAVAGVLLVGADLCRPPDRQLSGRVLLLGVAGYRKLVAPIVRSSGLSCRFSPTCSAYAEQVIRARGAAVGAWWTARRLIRCGPWTARGTADPAPIATRPTTRAANDRGCDEAR